MPHVSQNELDIKTKRQIINTFEMVLGKMNSPEINGFLFSLLSETERLMLAKRLAIALLLSEGLEHAAICEVLAITPETVSRIELSLLKKPKGFGLAIQKINEDKTIAEIKNLFVKLAKYSVKAAGGRVSF